MTTSVRCGAILLAVGACLCLAPGARAQSPIDRLPGTANALMTVEVAKLVGSKLGDKSDWQGKLMKGYADRPLAVPASSKRVSIAAAVHPGEMKTIWEAAVIELPAPPVLDRIMRTQGGYIDRINEKMALWTPRDVYYVQLADNTLGIVQPGQRQYVTRWVAKEGRGGLSDYLKRAQTAAGEADVLFAVDLDDVVGPMAVRYAFEHGQLPSLSALPSEARDKLFLALAGVQGMRLTAKVTDAINGDMVIEFGDSVDGLGDGAKAFVTDVLKANDLYNPSIDQWTFTVQGKSIVGKGQMRPESINEMMMLLSPAGLGAAGATVASGDGAAPVNGATPAAAQQGSAEPAKSAAAASQHYYRAVSAVLDSITAKGSPTDGGRWLVTKARTIEQLPILNVDPALLAWGNSVAETLNRVAAELGVGQQRARIASQGISTPTGGGDQVGNATEYRNVQRQREQAAQNERAASAAKSMDLFNQLLPTRGKIRAEMVQKYQVEF